MSRSSTRLLLALAALLTACAGRDDSTSGDTRADGVVREPIPRGIDPRMVEWRTDGVLVASQDSLVKTPGYVVDSIFPPEEALRRFQAEVVGPAPLQLAEGAASTDALLRRYWSLLVRHDTLAMTPLVVSKAEFAYLYYPEGAEASNGVPPNVAWMLLGHNSGRGLTRALRAASTRDTTVRAAVCTGLTQRVGQGELYGPCGVVLPSAGGLDTVWVAKTLFRRNGVHKLMGFHNEL